MTTLIIDLDETLLHSYENPQFLEDLKIYEEPIVFKKFHQSVKTFSMHLEKNEMNIVIWGVFRPYLKEFLDFVYKNFDHVVFWSAGTSQYVQEIIDQMVEDFDIPHGKVIWSREKCHKHAGTFHKPIAQLQEDLRTRYYSTIIINPLKTLILDDKTYTFIDNPANGVLIPLFHPGENPTVETLINSRDQALLKFMNWYNRPEVKFANDYRMLKKDNIFL